MLSLLVMMTKRGWPKQRLEVNEVGKSRFLSRDHGMVTNTNILKWGFVYVLRVSSVDQVTLKANRIWTTYFGTKKFRHFITEFRTL